VNGAVHELIADLNNRPMRHLGTTHRALFEAIEAGALLRMPAEPCASTLPNRIELPRQGVRLLLLGPYRLMCEVIAPSGRRPGCCEAGAIGLPTIALVRTYPGRQATPRAGVPHLS
jgi:hypothetical protein